MWISYISLIFVTIKVLLSESSYNYNIEILQRVIIERNYLWQKLI